jgi:hypothetical protein
MALVNRAACVAGSAWLLVSSLSAMAQDAKPDVIRIGVLGDSISKNRNAAGGRGWPLYLGKLLGKGYEVRTFSRNGVVCLRVPSISIWRYREMKHLSDFRPHIAIIMLGANTARRGLHQHRKRYSGD